MQAYFQGHKGPFILERQKTIHSMATWGLIEPFFFVAGNTMMIGYDLQIRVEKSLNHKGYIQSMWGVMG